jgi:hypothetical protein
MASQLNRTKVQAIRDPPSRHDNGCENRVEIDGIQVRSSDLPAGNVVDPCFKLSNFVTGQRSHEPGKTRFSNPKGELSHLRLALQRREAFPGQT